MTEDDARPEPTVRADRSQSEQRAAMSTLEVHWPDLLDAYQGFPVEDPDWAPAIRLDSGALTCRGLLGPDPAPLLLLPAKDYRIGFEQRRRFAEGLCDVKLANRLAEALLGPDPFGAFERTLSEVPVERHRFEGFELEADLQALDAFFRAAGIAPSPEPTVRRKVIEFPREAISPASRVPSLPGPHHAE